MGNIDLDNLDLYCRTSEIGALLAKEPLRIKLTCSMCTDIADKICKGFRGNGA